MNEYLILFAALALCELVIFIKGMMSERKRKQKLWQELEQNYGKSGRREYREGELESLSRYLEYHGDGFQIDEITWNDLGMDIVFQEMNQTRSSAGQEYLYYLLHTPAQEEKTLAGMEEKICWLMEHAEERKKMQMIFASIDRTFKYSIYDYLDFLDGLENRGCMKQIMMNIMLVVSLGGFLINVGVGLLCLLLVCCYNISSYLRDKREIEPYYVSFRYIFRLLGGAEKLQRLHLTVFAEEEEELKRIQKEFGQLKRSGRWGMRTMDGSGNPLELLFVYINMISHWDIMAFNRMLGHLRKKREAVDALITLVGRMETLIAIGSYRKYLGSYCVPELVSGRLVPLEMRELYHPLLKDPVKNSICVQRGVLLTGSNASGKSTFLKAAALSALLAQTIHTCPADFYRGNFFRILSSMALRDDIVSGESYYIVEIKSLKRILDAAGTDGNPVLCFVDEVLRGTNTVERIAASTHILKSLCGQKIRCFAATHDIELTELLDEYYDNYHFEEEISAGDISFPYRLLAGKAASRNAIKLLSVMGYEEALIQNAEAMAAEFVKTGRWSKTLPLEK